MGAEKILLVDDSQEILDGLLEYLASEGYEVETASDGISADTFSIVVTDSHPGFGDDSDLLEGAHFVGLKAARDNSNNAAMVEFGIKFKQIYWTNSRFTINRRDMRKPIASSQF